MAKNLSRLLIVCLLIIPTPVYAEEVEEVETFDDGEQTTDIVVPPTENNNLVKIDNTWSGSYGMDGHHIELEYMKHGGASNDYEFTLPTEHDVYEVGFTIGAVNNQGSVEYTHNDETTQSNTIDAQSGLNSTTMYEDIVYSVKETANKFIDSFVITINDWSLVDDISIKYDTTTTTTTTLNPLDVQRQANFASYGISETDEERGVREEEEAIIQQEIIQMEIQEAIEVEDNMAETGYNETNEERAEREARTNVTIIVGDEEVTYTEKEQNDGTIERDQERAKNEELYGVALTDEQIERGDLELYDIEEGEIGEEFFEDDDMVLIVADEYEDEEFIELTEEEYEELEKQMEIDAKALELTEELEIYEFETEEEAEEFIETYLEIEEYIEELEVFEEEVIVIEEDINLIDIFIDNDLFPPKEEDVLEDLKEVQDELIEEEIEEEIFDDVIEILEDEEPIEETVFEVLNIFDTEDGEEVLSEEMVEEEVAEVEEVIEDIVIEEVTTEEVVEVLEEVNDIGVQNLAVATEEVQEVVQAVVEEAIDNVEELTEEQVEVVAEVLQVEAEDVEIIAEAVKDDEVVAEAVEEYVERAVENADVENYTLADVVTEVQVEAFIEDPIGTLVDVDFSDVVLSDIGKDMSNDQKQKAQEVVVPVIITRIASMAAFILRKS